MVACLAPLRWARKMCTPFPCRRNFVAGSLDDARLLAERLGVRYDVIQFNAGLNRSRPS